jgi:hypothetical protein
MAGAVWSVLIVGPNHLLNHILLVEIERETRCRCDILDSFGDIPRGSGPKSRREMILADASSERAIESITAIISGKRRPGKVPRSWAIFNVNPANLDHTDVFRLGVKGIFLERASLEEVVFGVREVMEGGLSIPAEFFPTVEVLPELDGDPVAGVGSKGGNPVNRRQA